MTVLRACKRGEIPHIKVGRSYAIKSADCDCFTPLSPEESGRRGAQKRWSNAEKPELVQGGGGMIRVRYVLTTSKQVIAVADVNEPPRADDKVNLDGEVYRILHAESEVAGPGDGEIVWTAEVRPMG